MANVTQLNGASQARIDEVKVAYAHLRRLMDRLIVLRVSDVDPQWPPVAAYCGGADGEGAAIFANYDAAMAGLTTAYNALSNMDQSA